MGNPLFDMAAPNNGIVEFINEVKQMQAEFKGNPKEEVQKMLNNGQISQAQFNQYAQMANQIMQFIK